MPRRIGKTVWIICLTAANHHSFISIYALITALPGIIHLLTDLTIFKTISILNKYGLAGYFTRIISRGSRECNRYVFWKKLSSVLKICRCQRCVLFDTNACSIVAVKLMGWAGCLVTSTDNVAHEKLINRKSDTQIGRGAWYDTRFSTMEDALRHYIFGSISSTQNGQRNNESEIHRVSFHPNA